MASASSPLGLLFAFLPVFAAAPRAGAACNATCKRDMARCMATQCEELKLPPNACRRYCKPAAIRTLAYVQSECRYQSDHTYVPHQELRIRRGDQDPITVATFDSERVADPLGFCIQYGGIGFGGFSVLAFPLQRLGVSPDGSTVVYEVNVAAPFFPFGPLPPEENGIFTVRSDGTGRRRLGPPSGDKSFRLGPAFGKPAINLYRAYTVSPPISFSPDGRRIAFTDLGPALDGQPAVQIAVLDLITGDRRLLTRLPAGTDPAPIPDDPAASPWFSTCCPRFVDNHTIVFQTYTDPKNDPAGARPPDLNALNFFTVGIDGRHLTAVPKPALSPGAQVIPSFGVTGRRINVLRVDLPGTPAGPPELPGDHFPIAETFVQDGKRLLQLTNYRRPDTWAAFVTADRKRAVFMASADPLKTNPHENCQLFSMDVLGGAPRQITHLDPGFRLTGPGCFLPFGIGYGVFRPVAQDPVTSAILFNTTLDALKLRFLDLRDEIFAIRPNGSGLRQLTDAAGVVHDADGSVRVELPGPWACSAALH